MGKSSPSGSTTTTLNPWAGQAPFLTGSQAINARGQEGLYPLASQIGNTPISFPGFQTFASPVNQQQQAIQAQTNLAQNDPTMQAATSGINPYLSGQMLSANNPYLGGAFNVAAQAAIPQIQSGFEGAGRYGSGAMANAQASALTNLAGNMAYQNYSDQSQNQLKAMLLAPQISQGNFADIGQLASAGAQQQAFNQLPITQQLQQYFFNQQAPFQTASEEAGLLGQPMQGGSTNPYFTNPVGSILGTGLGALGLYNMANTASGGGISNYLGGLFGGGAAGSLGGAGGSGLSSTAMDALSMQALGNGAAAI